MLTIKDLYNETQDVIDNKLFKMKLFDRDEYERAVVQIELLNRLINARRREYEAALKEDWSIMYEHLGQPRGVAWMIYLPIFIEGDDYDTDIRTKRNDIYEYLSKKYDTDGVTVQMDFNECEGYNFYFEIDVLEAPNAEDLRWQLEGGWEQIYEDLLDKNLITWIDYEQIYEDEELKKQNMDRINNELKKVIGGTE